MANDQPPRDFQRARSDAQKQERRRDILRAARAHLAEVGFEGFSMRPLGKAAGVARGTLYLYFPTREEVLLALYLEEVRAWLEQLEAVTEPDMPVEAFLEAVYASATRRSIFLELAPRVSGVIESNVSIESLTDSKRTAAWLLEVAGLRTAQALGRPSEQGVALATALFALLVGVTQTLRTPQIEVAMLPADVQELLVGEDPRAAFVRVGRWLVEGSR